MDMIRLNSAPVNLFRFNSGDEREAIVAGVRLLMLEAAGRETELLRKNAGQQSSGFTARLSAADYGKTNQNTKVKLMMHAARIACSSLGEEAPADYQAFLSRQRDFFNDPTFLRVLSGITRDAIRPVLPYVISNALGVFCHTVNVPVGQTYEITVESNDIMVFQDSSWGAVRSVPQNELYNHTITLNPSPKAAAFSVKWNQLIGNDADIGLFFNSLAAGMYSKIMAMGTDAMIKASENEFFMPSGLKFNSYNTANWVQCSKNVAMVNHIRRGDVVAFGDIVPLSKVMPSGTPSDAALTYQLGAEYNSRGFLGTVMGVGCFPLDDAIVPGTQNSTVEGILPTDRIFMCGLPGNSHSPIYCGFEEGTPITLTMEPSKTADMTLTGELVMCADFKAVFGSKVGVIKNV